MELKWRALCSKNFILMPVFAIGFTFLMKLLYSTLADGGLTEVARAAALNSGVLMNISMTGIYGVCGALAEEKEKHTLRVLMTSSVNGLEFFLGSVIPVMGMLVAVNGILVAVAGAHMSAAQWGVYLLVSLLSAVASTVIGMIFGIFSKSQINASTVTLPAILVFMLIPTLADFSEVLKRISDFLFTGIMQNVVTVIVKGEGTPFGITEVLIIVAETVLALVCFLVAYKKNGYDPD